MNAHSEYRVPLVLGVAGHRDVHPAQVDAVQVAVRRLFEELLTAHPHTPLVLLSPLASEVDRLVARIATESGSRVTLVAVCPWESEHERNHWGPPEPKTDTDVGSRDGSTIADDLMSRAAQTISMPLSAGVTPDGLASDETQRQAQYDQAGRYVARHSQILIAVWDGVDFGDGHTAKMVKWFRNGAPAPYTVRSRELDVGVQSAVWHLKVCRTVNTATAPAGESELPQNFTKKVGPDRSSVPLAPQWEFPVLVERSYVRKLPRQKRQRFFFHFRSGLLMVHHWLHALSHRIGHASPNSGQQLIERRWRALDRFNADISDLPRTQPTQLQASAAYLLPDEVADTLVTCLQQLRRVYALADTSAANWQRTNGRVVLALFGMALLAVACLETYAHFVHRTWFLGGYLILLAGGYSLFRWTGRQEHQGRWLDYRALAEALRVQIFWRWAGLHDCVADHYLRHFRGEMDWIRHAARAAYLASGAHSGAAMPSSPLVESTTVNGAEPSDTLSRIVRHWVNDQRDFFTAKSPQNSELELSYETAARLAYFGAITIALFHVALHLATQHMSHALVLATFGCLVLTAFLEEYSDIQAYSLLSRRYRWMADLFGNAANVLAKTRSESASDRQAADHAQGVLFELGKEALTENADWVMQHRQRPPVLPGG